MKISITIRGRDKESREQCWRGGKEEVVHRFVRGWLRCTTAAAPVACSIVYN